MRIRGGKHYNERNLGVGREEGGQGGAGDGKSVLLQVARDTEIVTGATESGSQNKASQRERSGMLLGSESQMHHRSEGKKAVQNATGL